MQCNIDRRGRWVRGITGTICVAAGTALLLTDWFNNPWIRYTAGALLVAGGLFQWFEARKGWCIVRAAGFKTPM